MATNGSGIVSVTATAATAPQTIIANGTPKQRVTLLNKSANTIYVAVQPLQNGNTDGTDWAVLASGDAAVMFECLTGIHTVLAYAPAGASNLNVIVSRF